jgi:hypothetical protein
VSRLVVSLFTVTEIHSSVTKVGRGDICKGMRENFAISKNLVVEENSALSSQNSLMHLDFS